jgi:RNA polymerase sigma-B factor
MDIAIRSAPEAGNAPASPKVADSDRLREERALFARYSNGRAGADRDVLVERFLPLARSLARRYERPSEPFDDIFQVACVGLIKAIDRFDPSRDVSFASYATPTILGEIKRYYRDHTWTVRVPRELKDRSLLVGHNLTELSSELGRPPTVAELAAACALDDEQVLDALETSSAYRPTSLSLVRDNDDDAGDTLSDTVGTTDEGFDRAEDRATLGKLLNAITPRDRQILSMRFEDDMTQAEIADWIGLSQMQISRIIRQSLARLRAAAESPKDRTTTRAGCITPGAPEPDPETTSPRSRPPL